MPEAQIKGKQIAVLCYIEVSISSTFYAHFSYKSAFFLVSKFRTKLAFGFKILAPKILYEKRARKTLMKLTAVF